MTITTVAPIYYYHPDHLGTSTFLIDANGNAYQFFLNLPYGETMAEQLGSSYYKSPYKFNGKELDAETGLYYYGARYYNPKTSLWLSVDPLAEKYPGVSPYTYCLNNPIKYIDPDGREVIVPNAMSQGYVMQYLKEQLGESHGYSFNKNNQLIYSSNKSHKGYNNDQKAINNGIQKIIKDKSIVNVEISDTQTQFEIPIKRGTDLIQDSEGKIVMENGLPKLGGELRIVADQTVNVNNTGGALFYTNPSDQSNTGYLKMNTTISGESEFTTASGNKTGKNNSAVFIHELLDHGTDFIKNGNTNKTHGNSVDNVKYHNNALNNLNKEKRINHHD